MKIIFNSFLLISLIFILGCEKEKVQTKKLLHVEKKEIPLHVKVKNIQEELKQIDTIKYLENYIINIINEGSNANLGFPAGAMDKGYAHKRDALDIARYVVTLSGKKSSDDKKAKKAGIFYSSNCGGCHDDEGKGLSGAFPDLTLKTLKGIDKKKTYLKIQLDTLKKNL